MHDFYFWPTFWTIAVVLGVMLVTCGFLIYVERKVAAYVQDRLGPNRVGPAGLFQPIADGLKFLLKEDIIPGHVDKLFYLLAPAIAVGTSLLAIAVVPFGPTPTAPERPWPATVTAEAEANQADPGFADRLAEYNEQAWSFVIAPNVDIGFVFVFAVGSLAIYGIILGGWSSSSKYSFLGSLRSSAQLLSYEIPMGLSVLGVVLLSGSLNLERIINEQAFWNGWNVVYQPLAFLLFLTSIFAECNRLPFDLPEAEQELVGGYHTEYSSMKFALFFAGEYAHMVTTSFLAVALFLGGWHVPLLVRPESWIVFKVIFFGLKMLAVILLMMFIRWTLPRFRFDQLMGLAWKVFIPLGLVNLLCVMVVQHLGVSYLWLLPLSLLLVAGAAVLSQVPPTPQRRTVVVYRGHERVEVPAP